MYRPPVFQRPVSKHLVVTSQPTAGPKSWSGRQFNTIFVGISWVSEVSRLKIAMAISSATYLLDYFEYNLQPQNGPLTSDTISDSIISELKRYSTTYVEKIVGMAIPKEIQDRVPELCSRLWKELDCVPLILDHHHRPRQSSDEGHVGTFEGWEEKSLDEQADSMVRKCIRSFGPGNIPYLDTSRHGLVEIDSAFRAHLVDVKDLEASVMPETWRLAQSYTTDLKKRGVRIAFFGAIPRSKEVLSIKMSLMRVFRHLGADVRWYTPDPSPRLYPTICKMKNILQGSCSPEVQLTADEKLQLSSWVYKNAEHHWLCKGGPLRDHLNGGAHVVIIEDASLLALAPISKRQDLGRPIIFQSRNNINLGSTAYTPPPRSQVVLDFIWSMLEQIDMLVCQKPDDFQSSLIPRRKVGYMLASCDRFDGLNKIMTDRDSSFYGRQFNISCLEKGISKIDYPNDRYIFVQMSLTPQFMHARTSLEAYEIYYKALAASTPARHIPKLCICDYQASGHANDGFHCSVARYVESNMESLADRICINQIGPPDQVWNTLLTNAEVVVLFCDREDYEERFLQAVQKDKPTIRTEPAGQCSSSIPNKSNVYTVEEGDINAMAQSLIEIEMEKEIPQQKNPFMPGCFWDEVTTVGNAVSWLFLASTLSKGETPGPCDQTIYHLAQKEKDIEYCSSANSSDL